MRFPLLLCLWLSFVCAALPQAHADAVLHYFSEPGDLIGQGQEHTVTSTGGYTLNVTDNARVVSFQFARTVSDQAVPQSCEVDFSPPTGAALAIGDYPDIRNGGTLPTATQAGFEFIVDERSDGQATGQFQILEITYDNSGKLATFAADFVLHGDDLVPACYGQIRYNSSLPYLFADGRPELGANHYRVLSTGGGVAINVTRREGSTGPLAVDYATADGTDLAGRDYTATSGTLTWADGDTAAKTFTVPILSSGNPYQGDGTFLVKLGGPDAGTQRQAVVTVVNDDSAITFVHFVSQPGEFIGQGKERTFSIATGFTLTAEQNSAAVVSLFFDDDATTDFADAEDWDIYFGAVPGMVLGVGDYEDAQQMAFPSSGHPALELSGDGRAPDTVKGNFQVLDAAFDADGNVLRFAADFVQYSDGDSDALTGQVRYRSTVPLTTVAGILSFGTSAYRVSEAAGSATISVNRTGGSAGVVSVAYATSDGTAVSGVNYTSVSGTLSWADGDAAPKTFTVPVRDDGIATADLSVNLLLSGPGLGAIPQATLTITNADKNTQGVAQFSDANFQFGSANGPATISVNRTGGDTGTLSVAYATADGTALAGVNYTPVTGTLTWADGDATPKTFQVPLLDPLSGSISQTVALSLSGTNLGAVSKATLTILNANLPASGTLALSATAYAANEADRVATITVNRTGGSYGSVSVDYTTLDGTARAGVDYLAIPGTLTWADGDGSPKSFTVPIIDQNVVGGTRALSIRLTGDHVGAGAQATLTIADNDVVPPPTVSVMTSTPLVAEADGGKAMFLVSRTGGTTAPLTVAYKVKGAAKAGVDYKPVSGTVTIPAGAAKAKVKLKLIDHGAASDGELATKCVLLPSADGSYAVGGGNVAKVKIIEHD